MPFIITFFALGGMISGYILTVISGALPFFRGDFHLTTPQVSNLLGLILLGGLLAKVCLLFSDKFGRKQLIILTIILYFIGVVVFTHATSYSMLEIGRLLQGASMIMSSVAYTVYLTEIAPSHMRGKIVTVFQLSWTAGMLLANVVNFAYAPSGDWKAMFNIILVVPVILFFMAFILPPSPRWLALKGRDEEAKEVMRGLNSKLSPAMLQNELNSLTKKEVKVSKRVIFRKKYIWGIFLASALLILNQMTGINAIVQTSTLMLKQAGMSSTLVTILGSIGITGVNCVMTIFTIIYVDKLGRKRLLKIGTFGYLITMVIMGGILMALPNGALKGWLMLAGLMIGVGFIAFGPCGVIYVIVAEVLPNKVRSYGIIIGGFCSIIVGTFFISKFLVFAQSAGYGVLFMSLAFFALIYFLFSTFLVPDTSNKTLEEIEEMYDKPKLKTVRARQL